jgi:predicted transposase YbfD/YdcC
MGQVLHGSATTTEAIRRAIQHGQESLRTLAKRYGINQKTVGKWKNRTSVADLPTGPKEARSTVLSIEEEAVIVAFRRYTLLPLDDCLYALQPTIPHLAMIGMVETRVERDGKIACERRYHIAFAKLDARVFAAATRAHWGIENRLHWVLDVVFHDDFARLRTGYGPQNMAVVKHMAMNLVRNPKDKHSLKVRRKLANLNPNYLETIIRQTPLT